jgi:hypothetical protein
MKTKIGFYFGKIYVILKKTNNLCKYELVKPT